MNDVYDEEFLRKWCRRHFKTGQGQHAGNDKAIRDLPTMAFGRAIGWDAAEIFRWLNSDKKIPEKRQRAMSRFIRYWEAGLLEFSVGKRRKRDLVRRETPRHLPPILSVSITSAGPKLTLIGRAPPPKEMPRSMKK